MAVADHDIQLHQIHHDQLAHALWIEQDSILQGAAIVQIGHYPDVVLSPGIGGGQRCAEGLFDESGGKFLVPIELDPIQLPAGRGAHVGRHDGGTSGGITFDVADTDFEGASRLIDPNLV